MNLNEFGYFETNSNRLKLASFSFFKSFYVCQAAINCTNTFEPKDLPQHLNGKYLEDQLLSFSLTHVHSHPSSAFDLQLKAQKNENICAISVEISVK